MKPNKPSRSHSAILAVPAAALMLGAAQAGTIGLNLNSFYYNTEGANWLTAGGTPMPSGGGLGYQTSGWVVTAKAFGVDAANWHAPLVFAWWDPTPVDVTHSLGGGISAHLTAPAAMETGIGAQLPDWVTQTVAPGNDEVTWNILQSIGGQSPAVSLSGLAANYPNGYVVQTITAARGAEKSFDGVTFTDGVNPVHVDYTTYYYSSPNQDGTIGVSAASSTFTSDTLDITCDTQTSGKSSSLCGFIITDKPVVTSCFPATTTSVSGSSFTLTGTALGVGTLTYQWKHDGNNVGTNSPTYTVNTSTPADSGDYTLVVTSNLYPGEPATSQTIHVTVAVPATVTWDADTGTAGAQAGDGTWNLSTSNWWNGSADVAWSNPNYAAFGAGGSPSTVTLADNVTTSGLTFNGDYTLTTTSGKSITLLGNTQIATSANATFSLPLDGTGSLTKTGPGTLAIVSRGTFSGPITVQEGTLAFPVTGDIPGYWYQWLLNTPVINLQPGTTLTCPNNAFGWYGNNNATGVTININGATCQPNGAFGIGYNLTGGRLGTGTSRLDLGRSGGFDAFVTSLASSTTSVVDPAGGVLFRTDSGQTAYTFSTAQGTTPSGVDLDIPVVISGDGGVVKAGSGTLRLGASNTYSGGTTVEGGTLLVAGQIGGTTNVNGGTLTVTGRVMGSTVWLKDNTTLNVTAKGGVSTIAPSGQVNIGVDEFTMNTLNFSDLSSPSVAPITGASVNLLSPVTVNIASVVPVVGRYPLIKTSGSWFVTSLTLGTLPSGITASLVDDSANSGEIYLDVTAVAIPLNVWAGEVGGLQSSAWNIGGTANWKTDGSPSLYQEGNVVLFNDDSIYQDIVLNGTVNPSVVTFDHSAFDYNLSGTGSIAGATSLTKSGTGTLTIATANTYTGVTTIEGGRLVLQDAGASPLSGGIVDNAALEINTTTGSLTFNTSLAGTGTLTKSGPGALTITGGLALTTNTTVDDGTLEVLTRSSDAPYTVLPTATLKLGYSTGGGYAATNLKLHGDGAAATTGLYLKGGTTYNVAGTLELLTAPTTIRQYGTDFARIGIFDIWSTGLSCSVAASGSATDANVKFVSYGYGMSVDIKAGTETATGDFVLNGPLDVDHSGNGFYKRGDGSLRLNAAATANNRNVRIAGGKIICGIADCLGTNSNLQISTGCMLDLNGFNQTVAKLYFNDIQQSAGTWGATGSGATHIDDTRFSGTGVVTVASGPYQTWAAANAGGQASNLDYDNDGVPNGVEYFMGQTGSGFTANPAPVGGVVSWPKGATYAGVYGTDYVVQTSTDLSTWTDVPVGDLTSNGNPVQYTLPTTGPALFTRLKVTGP